MANVHGPHGGRRQKQQMLKPLATGPYSHPEDQNLQIYPEPRHYGYQTGAIEQYEHLWFGTEPTYKASRTREKYALRELGIADSDN